MNLNRGENILKKTFITVAIFLIFFTAVASCVASEDISADIADNLKEDSSYNLINSETYLSSSISEDSVNSNDEIEDKIDKASGNGDESESTIAEATENNGDQINIDENQADDTVSAFDNAISERIIDNEIVAATNDVSYTFSDLNRLVDNADAGSTIVLYGNCIYNDATDQSFSNGISLKKNLIIDGNGHYIDGKSSVRAFSIYDCTIVFKNLTIKNGYCAEKSGGAMLLYEGADITIRNCNFTNNKVYRGNGGVINANPGTKIKIYQSKFINNQAVHKSNLAWTSFKSGMGSAIRAYGTALSIYDSYFGSNSGYVSTVLLVSHSDGKFYDASLHVDNCIFEKNHATNQGAIYLDEFGKGQILNSIFRNNPTGEGGTVILDTSKSALVRNCTFEGNSGNNAGAINVKVYKDTLRSNVVIDKCTFIKNTVKEHGGAINLGGGNAKITNCKFVSNTAKKWAGAIYAHLGTITISGCDFTSNTAGYGGGVALVNLDSAKILNSNFNKNSAPKGGTVVVDTSKSVSIKNSKFIANKGEFGAAIYTQLKNKKVKMSITVDKCTFTKNSVSIQGGAICIIGGTLKLTNSVFTSNTARTYGGALSLRSGTLTVSKSKFKLNQAKYAGAVYIVSGKAKVKYSKFIKNAAMLKYPYAFSKVKKVFSKCSYKSNYIIKTKVTLTKSGKYMKVILKSNKGKVVNKKVKLTFKGPKNYVTKWYMTKKGKKSIKIPKLTSGTYTVSIKVYKTTYNPVTKTIKV